MKTVDLDIGTNHCLNDAPPQLEETPFVSSVTGGSSIDRRCPNGDVFDDVSVREATGSRDVDSGWAWVVLTVTCVIGAIMEVTVFSVAGMFQVEFQAAFGSSRSFLALVGSLFISSAGVLGPLSGILTKKLTPRVTMMLGASLLSSGMVLASLAESSIALLFTYGIIGGLGNGLLFTPTTITFSAYFNKHRQKANGLVMGAPGIGTLIGPFLMRWLIDTYGWRHSLAGCSVIAAQMCVLSSLVFPQPGDITSTLGGCCCLPGLSCRKRNRSRGPGPEQLVDCSKPKNGGLAFADTKCVLINGELPPRTDNKKAPSVLYHLVEVMKKKEVWIICINQMLVMSGYNIHVIHQPSYLSSVGVDKGQFPYLYCAFGVSLMMSRVASGFLFTRFHRHLIQGMFLFEIFMAIAVGLMPLYGLTLPTLYLYNVLIAITFGPAYMLSTPVLIEYIGVDHLPVAFGIMMMGCGSSSIGSTSMAGAIYDQSGSYSASFYLAGSLIGGGSLMSLLLCGGRGKKAPLKSEVLHVKREDDKPPDND